MLRTWPYSESSLIVDLFTRRYGRLRVISKGARRQKSYRSGLLSPFRVLLTAWSGKGELPILTSVEQISKHVEYSAKSVSCGYYLNELMIRFLHLHDPHEALFDHYTRALSEFAQGMDLQSALRIFEKNLLQETGFGLVLGHDADGGKPIRADRQYDYIADQGPVLIKPNKYRSGIPVSGATLHALATEQDLSTQAQAESKRLLRTLIEQRLGGKPLRSRRVMINLGVVRQKLIKES